MFGAMLASDRAKSIGICLLYGTTSVCLSILFKTVLSGYHFDGKMLLLSFQLAVAVVFCILAKVCHSIPICSCRFPRRRCWLEWVDPADVSATSAGFQDPRHRLEHVARVS